MNAYNTHKLRKTNLFKICSCLSEQECPSGLVDEETFKTIYSQFFPQGGRILSPQEMQGRHHG
jgi:hypothetical protein